MQTVYEAAGRDEGLLRLAHAWHDRVMADEIVSHAFSHAFSHAISHAFSHARHSERLGATTTTMARYHDSADVPDGLRIPCWSWDGLQD